MLSAAVTPLEKLLCLKRTCTLVRTAVQRNVDDHRSLHQSRTRPKNAQMEGEEEEGEVRVWQITALFWPDTAKNIAPIRLLFD